LNRGITSLVSGLLRVYDPRMKTRMLLAIAAVVGFRLTLSAVTETINLIVVDRQTNYVQTSAGTAALDGSTPYEFVINLDGQYLRTSGFSLAFKKPGDAVTTYQGYEHSAGYEWQAPIYPTGHFTSMANLNTTFPGGDYTILVSGYADATLTIPNLVGSTNDGFGNTPFVNATQNGVPVGWFNNRMVVDPTQDLLIQSTTFTVNYVAGDGRIGLNVSGDGFDQEVTNETVPGNFIFSGNSVQMLITGGTLSPGGIYYGDVEFNNVVSELIDLSGIYTSSTKGVSVYTAYTSFQIQAVPEPATYAAWAALLALGTALWRRRRA